MKKILVTGADGFIGRHCLPFLKKRNFEIHAVFFKEQRCEFNEAHWIDFNLLQDSVEELVGKVKPTHLLHLAWNVAPGKFWNSLENLSWVKSSIDLFEAFALQGGKRAVTAGTCAEYDWTAKEFCEDRTPCFPHTLYGTSKHTVHLILQSLAKQFGFSQAWGRIFYLYGPHEYPERLVPSVIHKLLKKETMPCSHGSQVIDFLHVEDVASAFVSLVDSEMQGAINIASGVGISVKQVIETIAERLQGKEWIQFGAIPAQNGPDALVAMTKKLNEELQWRPHYSLEDGLMQTIDWWKSKLVQ